RCPAVGPSHAPGTPRPPGRARRRARGTCRMSARADRASALAKFDAAACRAANEVIGVYSTSFGLATRLLGRRHRQHVRNLYAMVRVADEIVDGMAAQAGLDRAAQHRQLDAYEAATHAAMAAGCSSDLVLHAFARTA